MSSCKDATSASRSVDKIKAYISKRQWAKLRKYLHSNGGCLDIGLSSQSDGTVDDRNVVTEEDYDCVIHAILLMACKNHPPVDIVNDLSELCPDKARKCRNIAMQTPLHVAASFGAHPEVVELLNDFSPDHASIVDSMGRTPLHLHCKNCCAMNTCDPMSFENEILAENPIDSLKKCGHYPELIHRVDTEDHNPFKTALVAAKGRTTGPIPDVLETLILAYPEALLIEDKSGRTPLDYCVLNRAPRRIIQKMQKLTHEFKSMPNH